MKFKKVLIFSILCFAAIISVFAEHSPRVIDNANLLFENEKVQLTQKLDQTSVRLNTDIAVLTVDDIGGSDVAEFADSSFENYGYGFGDEADGILLLINMAGRDLYITTHGSRTINIFTDSAIDYVLDEVALYLGNGEYYSAFDTFAELCDEIIYEAQNHTDDYYDNNYINNYSADDYGYYTEKTRGIPLSYIPICVVIGLVVSLIVVGGMKRQLKSVRSQTDATQYVKSGSMNLTGKSDMFLYHTVNRTKKPEPSNNNHSSPPRFGGGSTTHTSSSGSTFGGGGRKF